MQTSNTLWLGASGPHLFLSLSPSLFHTHTQCVCVRMSVCVCVCMCPRVCPRVRLSLSEKASSFQIWTEPLTREGVNQTNKEKSQGIGTSKWCNSDCMYHYEPII